MDTTKKKLKEIQFEYADDWSKKAPALNRFWKHLGLDQYAYQDDFLCGRKRELLNRYHSAEKQLDKFIKENCRLIYHCYSSQKSVIELYLNKLIEFDKMYFTLEYYNKMESNGTIYCVCDGQTTLKRFFEKDDAKRFKKIWEENFPNKKATIEKIEIY